MQLPSKEELRPWLNRGGLALTLLILVVLAYVIGHQPKESPSLLQPVTAQTPGSHDSQRPDPAEQGAEAQQRTPDIRNPEDRHKLEEMYSQRLKQLQAMDQPPAQPKQPSQDQPKPKQESPPQRGLIFDLIQGTPDMLEPKVNPNIKGEMKMPERKLRVPQSPRRVPNEDRFDPNRPYRFRNNESPPPDRDQGGTPS
jgi:hypothetical protein